MPGTGLPEGDVAVALHAAALELDAGHYAAALAGYEQALLLAPASRPAHAGLYYALTALGDRHAAANHLAQALLLQSIVALPYRRPRDGTAGPVRVLLLQSINAGNVLIQRLLDDRIFATSVLIVEFYQPGTPLPPHDVVLNAIGDADIRVDALDAAQCILIQTSAPVLNPIHAILATTRCRNAERLAGLPGVRTARTVEFSRAALRSKRTTAMLERHGLSFPLLLRAPGYHMGQYFVRAEAPAAIAAALAEFPEEVQRVIAIEYLDGRGKDGLTRKYRVLFIDGALYPVHLAVSEDWKIHYFSAAMAQHPERRNEDARFLADMDAVLGSKAMTALAAIRDVLALDYAGIDFGMDRDGNLLFYEANANMAVIRPGPEPMWDYRRPAIERIHHAVHQMLIDRANVARAQA
jgi:glutathione synthase/RimK-type ligase-like ATP-grasp enzyme